jgi:hypothetical protein
MPNQIQLKRGLNANLAAATLQAGEPAFTTDDGKLYISNGTAKVLINPDSVTGNAATATKLATARTIALSGKATGTATSFDGTINITIPVTAITDAAKLTTARSIAISGGATGTATNFDGSAAITIPVTALDVSKATAGTLPVARGGTGVVTITGVVKGNGTGAFTAATAADIPNLTLSKITDAGTAASKNTGTASGNVPILDSGGKLAAEVIPAVALVSVQAAATEAAQLALTAQVGDICVRSDTGDIYILQTTPATALANWLKIDTPLKVISVNGMTGAVSVTTITGNAGTATKLQTARSIAISGGATGTATNFDGSAAITIPVTALDVSKATAGTLPVARGGTGATTLTGMVKGNGTGAFTAATAGTDYLAPNSIIDGGTF